MSYTNHVTVLGQPVEAVCFTSDDGTAQLRAGLSLGSGLVVELAGNTGRQEFHCDPGQADALGRWLVAKAAEYRGAAHAWITLPPDSDVPPGDLAGFDTMEQALVVVAGLSELEMARRLTRSCGQSRR